LKTMILIAENGRIFPTFDIIPSLEIWQNGDVSIHLRINIFYNKAFFRLFTSMQTTDVTYIRTVIKAPPFTYFCQSVMLDSLSCSFT
jgi:hypothetical protein